jgi:hypothetical protein
MNISEYKNNIIVCYYSDELFNGYQIIIESEKLNDSTSATITENILNFCYTDLYDHLKKFKFNNLLDKLKEKKNLFHIHEDISLQNNKPIYICSH